ncbi:nucleoid-associated protein [Methylocaldum sp.]|uniref:nucleoid-associated protein n=1 Tax=Methylocaldum sp. TaxID=1969727 RepID=UPI002D40182E|nr:nucleoid-associated protein [Methylocaldum sp.]HYE34052.1 nucleoid-associated protein [Methylocaldum sp.]
MQKIALVRLTDGQGGKIVVRDRSEPAHISDYFQGFLEARRVNSPEDMSGKVVEAFKQTFKEHRTELPPDIRTSGVNRIYDVLRQGGHRFDPDNPEPLITAIFGHVAEDAPVRKTLKRKLKEQGIAEETFDIDPEHIPKPKRRRLETVEGTHIIFDEEHEPETRPHGDGRTEIVIVTAQITRNDVDIEKGSRGN